MKAKAKVKESVFTKEGKTTADNRKLMIENNGFFLYLPSCDIQINMTISNNSVKVYLKRRMKYRSTGEPAKLIGEIDYDAI
jgi:hypothetical protein